ncbi:MAG: fibronectin type III domain-containing protein, partial [Gemmatimonadetes bacterium]|nr:fibronectin type III domain-containing protein [Gemmatimonadota bacterium]
MKIADAAGNATTFLDSTISPATTYSYAVRAIDGANNASVFSNTASVTTPAVSDTTPPTVPANLVATAAGSQSIVLNWNASTDAGSGLAGYRIFRDGTLIAEVVSSVLTFSDTGLEPNTQYAYLVRAFDGDGNVSDDSNVTSATTAADTTPPSVPTGLTATATGSQSITLDWNASTDTGGSGLAAYRLYREGMLLTAVAAGTTSYTDPTVLPDTSYSYRVSAIDNAGNESTPSAAAGATTPADTVAPSPPSGLTAVPVGATRIDLTWNAATDTGGSGLAGYRVFRDGTEIA